MEPIVDLLQEVQMLAHTPRSGFAFLGTGQQSVAEHSYCTAVVALALAKMVDEPINRQKLLQLCLFHDLLEARTGDLNYVHKRYVSKDDSKALDGLLNAGSDLAHEIGEVIKEYEGEASLEAQLAHDADQLELILVLKRLYDTGNPRADKWMDNCAARIKTDVGKQLMEAIRSRDFDAWWQV